MYNIKVRGSRQKPQQRTSSSKGMGEYPVLLHLTCLYPPPPPSLSKPQEREREGGSKRKFLFPPLRFYAVLCQSRPPLSGYCRFQLRQQKSRSEREREIERGEDNFLGGGSFHASVWGKMAIGGFSTNRLIVSPKKE